MEIRYPYKVPSGGHHLQIKNTQIPRSNIEDKICWNITPTGTFSVKSAIWTNNTNIDTHPKAKFISSIWSLHMTPKIQLFVWKLTQNMLLLEANLLN